MQFTPYLQEYEQATIESFNDYTHFHDALIGLPVGFACGITQLLALHGKLSKQQQRHAMNRQALLNDFLSRALSNEKRTKLFIYHYLLSHPIENISSLFSESLISTAFILIKQRVKVLKCIKTTMAKLVLYFGKDILKHISIYGSAISAITYGAYQPEAIVASIITASRVTNVEPFQTPKDIDANIIARLIRNNQVTKGYQTIESIRNLNHDLHNRISYL